MFRDIRFLTGINASILFFYALAALFIVPQFEKLFEGFGAELPAATRFVIDSYHYWWLIPVLMIVQFLYLRFGHVTSATAQRFLFVLNLFFVALEVLFVPAMIIIFYLPIFYMGKVVSVGLLG